jgi:beta-galactosidase
METISFPTGGASVQQGDQTSVQHGNARLHPVELYPYGTEYYRYPTPTPENWAGDLREISRAGYNHIRLHSQWRCHERRRGQFQFDDLDALYDLAAENGLKIVLQPHVESAPDWVFSELGGSRIGFHGLPIPPFAHGCTYVGGWWPCFDNPGVRAAAREFLLAIAGRYREHPAWWFCNAWNEPVSRPLGQCQCEHSVRSYRQWLRAAFGSIERLNDIYGKAWTDFETILPPTSGSDFAEMFLWRHWASDAVASHVRLAAEALREAAPGIFLMTHPSNCLVVQDPICETSDDFANAKEVDRYGSSLWVALNPKTPLEACEVDYSTSWLRRIDPHWWCYEFYPNHDNWCRPPAPAALARNLWLTIANGATGITFWQYRSERVGGTEVNGHGLRTTDGMPTPRSKVAEKIAKVLAKKASLLNRSTPPKARAALVYHRDSDMISRIQIMKNWLQSSIATEAPRRDYHYKQCLRRAHCLLALAFGSCDWVVAGDDLSEYEVVYVPPAEMLPASCADWLDEYCRAGGTAIVEMPASVREENTWLMQTRPSGEFAALTGCREAERFALQPRETTFSWNGRQFAASGFQTILDLLDADCEGTWADGSPAVARRTCGYGKVITFGGSPSLAFGDTFTDPMVAALRSILPGEPAPLSPTLWMRERRVGSQKIIFAFNFGEKREILDLPGTVEEVWWGQTGTPANGDLDPGETWVGLVSAG